MKENIEYKKKGSKRYKYIKILNLQERNKKSNSLNLNGKDFSRFILKEDKNRTFPRHKSKEELGEILQSYYQQRKEYILKRRSKKTIEKLNEIHETQADKEKVKTRTQNSLKYISYQQKLFDKHYNYQIEDKLEGYYIKKDNNKVIINNFSKNIQIIDAGDEIVSLKKNNKFTRTS